MCNHELNKRGSHSKDALLGMEECQSLFGIYELKIPVDKNLACNAVGVTGKNCKDLDVSSVKLHYCRCCYSFFWRASLLIRMFSFQNIVTCMLFKFGLV